MAKNVSIQMPELQLGKVDLVFKVKDGTKVFGDLKVSKGGIEWRPRNKHHGGGKTIVMSWAKFSKLMEEVAE
ncbi:MAG: hypothetical protein RR784_06655 [Burkholderiaceae bacterium]